jgi:hypothetical protein
VQRRADRRRGMGAGGGVSSDAIRALQDWDRRDRQERDPFEVLWDKKKPLLPELPADHDLAGLCGWLTSVLHLNRRHPVTRAFHEGVSGPAGHVALARLNAPTIRFEPASKMTSAQRLAETLIFYLQPGDSEPYPWTGVQTIKIARVIWLLCGAWKSSTVRDETEAIVSAFISAALEIRGYTHGTPPQRYEAAVALRPEINGHGQIVQYRYLLDLDSDEVAIRVGDLTAITRKVIGGSIAYGWLDARMDNLGWRRVRLEGRSIAGREGRREGAHARADIYRGKLEWHDPVTT